MQHKPSEEEPASADEEELASSYTVGGVNPLEPWPDNSPIHSSFDSILSFNQNQINMANFGAPIPATSSKEIKLNPPKSFDGSRDKFGKFLQDAELYLLINDNVYAQDREKIGFVLSFMNEGQAGAWAS